MKIRKEEIDNTNIGNLQSIKSSIADENLGLALNMVSKNLYSNPIGSFIRELVSNAVDANNDANEISPVMVHIYKEDGTGFIEVKDNGIGISKENFESIYMSWFNSDKRHTNDKIGGWGLGSKSPLAYQDSFEIITRYNGIEYHYILANEETVPASTLILEEETDKSNGTTIRVEIKEDDYWKIHQQCKKQLVYFNNVYVKNEIYFYDNNFTIYESDKFKLRNKDFPYNNEMHIVLGQVAYPINWNVLDLDRVNIPVGIKFNIGDLEVTLSREEINYTNTVKELIKAKIEEVTDDLVKKYEEQCKITNLFEYIKLVKSNKKPPLVIGDIEIDMTGFNSSIYFTPFDGIKIHNKQLSSIFSLYNVTALKSGKKYQQYSNSSNYYHHLYNHTSSCYLVKDDKLNYFDTLYINNGYLFKRGSITKSKFRTFVEILKLKQGYSNMPDDSGTLRTNKDIIKEGSSLMIFKVIKYIDEFLDNVITHYGGQAPQHWIDELKKKEEIKKEETKGEITIYDIYNKRSKVNLREFLDNYKAIFYINRQKNKAKILHYNALYDMGNSNFKNKTAFIMISPSVISQIKKFNNVHHIDSIFKVASYSNLLCRIKLNYIFYKEIHAHKKSFYYSPYYLNLFDKIANVYNMDLSISYYQIPNNDKERVNYEFNIYEVFKDKIDVIKENNNKVFIYEYEMKILIKAISELYLLQYLSNAPLSIIQKYVKEHNIRKLSPKYYLTSN